MSRSDVGTDVGSGTAPCHCCHCCRTTLSAAASECWLRLQIVQDRAWRSLRGEAHRQLRQLSKAGLQYLAFVDAMTAGYTSPPGTVSALQRHERAQSRLMVEIAGRLPAHPRAELGCQTKLGCGSTARMKSSFALFLSKQLTFHRAVAPSFLACVLRSRSLQHEAAQSAGAPPSRCPRATAAGQPCAPEADLGAA